MYEFPSKKSEFHSIEWKTTEFFNGIISNRNFSFKTSLTTSQSERLWQLNVYVLHV